MSNNAPVYRLLWAKADKNTPNFHRLLYHLIDVGSTARALWPVIAAPIRADLATWLGLNEVQAGHLIAFWAALHDLGKASPAFQYHQSLPTERRQAVREMLEQQGLNIPFGADMTPPRHEVISTWALKNEPHFHTLPGLSQFAARLIGQALGGHHGHWPNAEKLDAVRDCHRGDRAWAEVRRALVDDLIQIFQPPDVPALSRRKREDNIAMTLFSGFVTLADWIASNSDFFPYEHDPIVALPEYKQTSSNLARRALERICWHIQPPLETFNFAEIFGFERNAIQQTIRHELAGCVAPSLAIIELPMGGGKTEAAFDTAMEWAQCQGTSGLYVAMPTMATSNQMYLRASDFLQKLFGPATATLLVHSAAFLQRSELQPAGATEPIEERAGEHAADLTWFLPSKKSLLAPFGVGTVDQTLLGVLQTKHSFLRLFALSHKVVIFDEVHAYDSYMNTLFERLLKWLHAVQCSVVILSATLPQRTRQSLIKAYAGEAVNIPDKAYPRVTWVDGEEEVGGCELPSPETQILAYDWLDNTDIAIAERLRIELQFGGCAAVICNTVARAQDLYKYLRDADLLSDTDQLLLFHARTPFYWRDRTERHVLGFFGPGKDKNRVNPQRPKPGQRVILIATQVIEQSLDLDFDVMISELAPIDLLLQRAGRLHRHAVNNPLRWTAERRLWIAAPPEKNGLPRFDQRTTSVYDLSMLYRTWLIMRHRTTSSIVIPGDLQALIDAVYSDIEISGLTDQQREELEKAQHQFTRAESDERKKAQQCRVCAPEDSQYLYSHTFSLEEDDPTVHRSLRALTRSGASGIKAVCLHRRAGQLWLDANNEEEGDRCLTLYHPSVMPRDEIIYEMIRRTVSIDREKLQAAIFAQDDAVSQAIRKQWKNIPALRYAQPLVFDGGICELGDFRLRLDRVLGLLIERTT